MVDSPYDTPDNHTPGPADTTRPDLPRDTRILITGGNGFVGSRMVRCLLEQGFTNLACITRSGATLQALAAEFPHATVDLIVGNLLSPDACRVAVKGAEVVYHLAAGFARNFPGCVLNSVVTTRNLLDAVVAEGAVTRFVNVSSMSVYSNEHIPRRGPLREDSEIDARVAARYDPYAYAKAEQDVLVARYSSEYHLPVVTVRPGFVIGPGKRNIPGRVGNGAFGVFLHVGLSNEMPFTYVDNCADAIAAAGLAPGIEGEVIIVVDDNRPTSRQYLRRYKRSVGRFVSVPTPYAAYFALNFLLERYSRWSEGQLPMTFNRRSCRTYYKGNTYSNARAKELLGWTPQVPMDTALDRCFDFIRSTKGQS